jgi:hypothetical protein
LQHRSSTAQSVSALHGLQLLPTHLAPPLQSTSWQQVPARQIPEQHLRPAPHWASTVQGPQTLLWQTRPEHRASPQQSPLLHTPAQHTWPEAHWESALQDWHVPLAQTLGAAQSAVAQQAAARQVPEQHLFPGPHCPSVEHS